jgi:PKD repeat protein
MKKVKLLSLILLCSLVSMAQLPVADFSVDDSTICPGTCTNFTSLSTNATSYHWTFSGANPSTSTTADPQGICYNAPGIYSVKLIASNSNGSDTLTITNCVRVYPYPPPLGLINHGDTLIDPQGLFAHYQWYLNGVLIPDDTLYWHVAIPDGWHSPVGTDLNGCEVEAADFSFPANPDFITSDSEFCAGSCINLVNLSTPSIDTTAHQWHFYGAFPSTSLDWNPQNICYNSAGTFMIKLVMLSSLHSYSDSFMVNVLPCTGILENISHQLSLSPNPFSTQLNLRFQIPQNSTAILKIINSIGESMVEKEIKLEDQMVNLEAFPNGIYLLAILSGNEIFTQKILKQ